MTSRQIRQQFLDFFASKGHAIVESSPVVPHDDPTLMFANAGMNQFKDVFLGTGSRTYKRVADTQKCIRAGGKHNDLDDVGQDSYHHTFFEMLGNWSFGDYFKKEAIEWAWELLTKVWGIDKDRLHATYFEGDEAEGLEPDTEAAELWKTVTDIDPSQVHPGGKKDNFWEMGDTGPCGPCSEIHIDLTPDKSGRELVNAGDPRVIELWNLVFIQFNRGSGGKLTPLPAKHVDTGMGFERLCAVLAGKNSNYDTDVFTPIFEAIQKRTGAPKYRGTLPSDEPTSRDRKGAEASEPPASAGAQSQTPNPYRDREGADNAPYRPDVGRDEGAPDQNRDRKGADENDPSPERKRGVSHDQVMIDVSYRVIADHVRCLSFALTDGAIPSNEGRGYVLRRVLRRAVRYGRQYMDMHEPFLCDLVEPLVAHMADVFPDLRTAHSGKNLEHVTELIRDEEASFIKTLDRGIRLFTRASADAVGTAYAALGEGLTYVGPEAFAVWEGQDDVRALQHAAQTLNFMGQDGEEKQVTVEQARQVLAERDIRIVISGKDAFRLHDTYGFPIDLTQLMAEEQGLAVDLAEYERLMEEARERARGTRVDLNDPFDPATYDVLATGKSCDDSLKYIEPFECRAYLWGLGPRNIGLFAPDEAKAGDEINFSTNRTPFYAEQGGQVADTSGVVRTESGDIKVHHVERLSGIVQNRKVEGIIHKGTVTSGTIRIGQQCHMAVDLATRIPTMRNHTSTHLLNWALREVLGKHVQQKGSLVDPEKTRFDFSHDKPLTGKELESIESLVNQRITEHLEVFPEELPLEIAQRIKGSRAVFGERYPDPVRVVSIGKPLSTLKDRSLEEIRDQLDDEDWKEYSVEFCGGTHLKNTGEAGRFVLISEEGVAKGIRRVVGITGDAAREAEATGEALLAEAGAIESRVGTAHQDAPSRGLQPARPLEDLSATLAAFQQKFNEATIPLRVRHELRDRITELQRSAREQQKQAASASGEAVMVRVASLLDSAEEVAGVTIVVGEVPAAPADALRRAIDWVRNKTAASAVLLATVSDDRVTLVAGMSRAVVDRGIKAGDLIKEVSPLVGGKGGGRPDMAQGGGNDPSGLPDALDRAASWIREQLS